MATPIHITTHAAEQYRDRWAPHLAYAQAYKELTAVLAVSHDTGVKAGKALVWLNDSGIRLVVSKPDAHGIRNVVTVLPPFDAVKETPKPTPIAEVKKPEAVKVKAPKATKVSKTTSIANQCAPEPISLPTYRDTGDPIFDALAHMHELQAVVGSQQMRIRACGKKMSPLKVGLLAQLEAANAALRDAKRLVRKLQPLSVNCAERLLVAAHEALTELGGDPALIDEIRKAVPESAWRAHSRKDIAS